MTKPYAIPPWQKALVALAGTVVGIVTIGVLYWAQVVFLPVALAVFLAFLLNPVIRYLERRGLGRFLSVLVIVLVTTLMLGGLGWVIVRQGKSLLEDLPNYTVIIQDKIKSVRQLGAAPDRLAKMIDDLGKELSPQPPVVEKGALEVPPDRVPIKNEQAKIVEQPGPPAWLVRLRDFLGSVMEVMASLALALVLVVFMLIKREDLRNRFISFVGHDHMSYTTKAVDEISQRISRYLMMQAVVNGAIGLALAIGLFLIGVKYAFLWGFLVAMLRYLPYVGIWVASLFPIVLSLAMFDGWWETLAVIGLFLVLEVITANLIEPRLLGQSMGVSEVALLIIAAFSAFLWGPVGLVLAAPLTVCLAVLGKYVPHLRFLDILLSDELALKTGANYYQRLLARDRDEAVNLVLSHVKSETKDSIYDELLIPALSLARRDRHREELNESDEQFIHETTAEILKDLAKGRTNQSVPGNNGVPAEKTAPSERPAVLIIGCPAQDEADRLALEMLQQLLDPTRWQMEVTAVATLTAELAAKVADHGTVLVCIGSLPPGGMAETRYLCKRLRARASDVKIIVGRWGLKRNVQQKQLYLQDVGADQMTTSLLETRDHLNALYHSLAQPSAVVAQRN